MSSLTSKEVRGLMEAYQQVYAPQEITEEQVWEQVEEWVNGLLDEGYDLSEYTWEEMYEAYIEEQGRSSAGAIDPQVQARWRAIGNTLAYGNAEGRRPSSSSRQTGRRPAGVAAPQVSNIPPSEGTGKPGPGRLGNISPNEGTGRGGPSDIKAKPSGSAPAPATARPSGSAPAAAAAGGAAGAAAASRPSGGSAGAPATARPSGAAPSGGKPTAAAAPAAQTGDRAKDMDTWAKANPKLAAASAERARIRGTQQTDNPLMKDFKSRLPMNSPSVQSPDVAKLGKGNQSLTQNPSAFKAAPAPTKPAPAATATSTSTPAPTKPAPAATPAATTPKPTPAATGSKKPGSIVSSFDVFDVVIGHLLDEGYADTEEAALAIMTNMSEEWRESIIESRSANRNPDEYERNERKNETSGQRAERKVRGRLETMDPEKRKKMIAQMRAVGLNV